VIIKSRINYQEINKEVEKFLIMPLVYNTLYISVNKFYTYAYARGLRP
jgi:hypothetical protein